MNNYQEESVLNTIFTINTALIYSIDSNHIVTVLEPQVHVIQRFLRYLGFRIPLNKKIALDSYSSFIFLQIDGIRNIKEIGVQLDKEFGEAVHPLYQRLLQLLQHMETDRLYITRGTLLSTK